MADVSFKSIFDAVRARVPDDESASKLLAAALDALEMEAREAFTPQETLAIGTYMMGANAKELEAYAGAQPPETQKLVGAIKTAMVPLADDLLQIAKEFGGP